MRVISQDGAMDVPYDIGHFTMEHGKYKDTEYACIKCHGVSFTYTMAEYTNKEKALKVMELMRTQYTKHYFTTKPFGFIPPKVFKFPQDSEVEV